MTAGSEEIKVCLEKEENWKVREREHRTTMYKGRSPGIHCKL